MSGKRLTEELKVSLRAEVEALCGRIAGPAVAEVFLDTKYHGSNYTCELVDQEDHLVVVLECECSKSHGSDGQRDPSVLGGLFEDGIVLYYYHSIIEKRHHICLAVRKIESENLLPV